MAVVQLEIAEDLNERLEFNSNVLTRRGRQITRALRIMFAAPFVGALVFGLLTNWESVVALGEMLRMRLD